MAQEGGDLLRAPCAPDPLEIDAGPGDLGRVAGPVCDRHADPEVLDGVGADPLDRELGKRLDRWLGCIYESLCDAVDILRVTRRRQEADELTAKR
jgi:hypothetical protein